MYYSDQPISRPNEDLFGRAPFALTLARAIDQLRVARDGFVIAICGEWGSGKTSVLRLVRRYLLHVEMERASEKPLNWETNAAPKTLAELDAMADTFEHVAPQIASLEALNKDTARCSRDGRWRELRRWLDTDESAEIADRYWQLKNYVNAHPRTIVIPFSPWLVSTRAELAFALLSDMAKQLGDRLGADVRAAFGDLLNRLSEISPLAAAGVDLATHGIGGSILRAFGQSAAKVGKRLTTGPTLDELRNRLKDVLNKLEHQRILVVIDDVDRLTPSEALEMVSFVKSLGDLPNVVYLLSYDDEKLASLIGSAVDVDGHSFLEKIVQYSVHLPLIDSDDLVRALTADLGKLVGDLSDADQRRLSYAWFNVLRQYMRTPRDIRRFVNSVAFARSGLADYTDAVDLVLLEALRLYEPALYEYVREHLSDLTG